MWLWFHPGTWWPSVLWWTPRRTHRPSSSGTFWLDRRREGSTVRAPHTGPYSSQYSWLPHCPTLLLLSHLLVAPAVIESVTIGPIVFLRWSHDGKFFARMTTDTLSIYETPVSCLPKESTIHIHVKCDTKAVLLLLSVYGLAWQEESQDQRDQVSLRDKGLMVSFLYWDTENWGKKSLHRRVDTSLYLQGLLMVSWWQHHSILGTRGQRHPSQSDSDAVAFPPGDPCPQPLQRCWLQTALAEKRRLPVC